MKYLIYIKLLLISLLMISCENKVVNPSDNNNPEIKKYRIEGYIGKTQGNTALQNASIHLLCNQVVIDSTKSSSNGYYSFANLDSGKYIVKVSKNGFTSTEKSIILKDTIYTYRASFNISIIGSNSITISGGDFGSKMTLSMGGGHCGPIKSLYDDEIWYYGLVNVANSKLKKDGETYEVIFYHWIDINKAKPGKYNYESDTKSQLVLLADSDGSSIEFDSYDGYIDIEIFEFDGIVRGTFSAEYDENITISGSFAVEYDY
jgi:hypothetical protein